MNLNYFRLVVLCAVGQILGAAAAMAAPPPNDSFSNRINLNNALPVSTTGSNVDATVQTGEPLPDSATNSVWWRWTAPSSGSVEISTSGSLEVGGDFPLDTVLAVYTGTSLAGLALVVENDESSEGTTSLVRFAAASGTTYAIQVTGWQEAQGSIKLAIKAGPPLPPNDAFANAVTLTTGVAAAGTTDGATLQPSEPVPVGETASNYKGSAWWAWTAPASGWYRLAVTGAGYNTVLSVWSGAALTGLAPVHSNRGGNPTGGAAAGDLFFQAVSGTRYPIAVGNAFAVDGVAVSLTMTAAVPPVRNESLTVSSSSVNVTTAAATINAVFRLTSTEAVESGYVDIAASGENNYYKSVPFDAAQRTSGTATDGTYTVPLVFPRYLAPGSYRIERMSLYLSSDYAGIGEQQRIPFADGATRTVAVTNTGAVDDTAPALTSVTAAPASVNITGGDATVTVTLQITDALAGFGGGSLRLRLEGSGFSQVNQSFSTAERISGTAQNGTYRVLLTVPGYLETGNYALIVANLEDVVGTSDYLEEKSTDVGFPGPFSGTISVTKTAVHRLNTFTITPASADVTAGQVNVTATYSVTTDQGQYSYGVLSFRHPTAAGSFGTAIFAGDRTTGTATAGTYSVTFPVPPYLVPGLYSPELVVYGTMGESSRYGANGLPFPAEATPGITVTNTGSTDTTPPAPTFLSSTPASLNPGGPTPLSVSVRATDALSGVDRVEVWLKGPGASTNTEYLGLASLDSGTSIDGTWKVSAMVPGFIAPGVYIFEILAVDGVRLSARLETNPAIPTQTVTLTAGSSFTTWAAANSLSGPHADPDANPDGDADTNLMEFGMGTDPRSGESPEAGPGVAGKPAASTTGSGDARRLILQFWIPEDILGANALKLTYTAQFSSDGRTWTDVPQSSFVIDAGTSLTTSTGLRRFCTATDPVPYSESDQRIGRIKVTQNP